MDLSSFPLGDGNSATGNSINGASLPLGTIGTSGRWGLKGLPYVIQGSGDNPVRVAASRALTIDPGVVVKLYYTYRYAGSNSSLMYPLIVADGVLVSSGAVFTSVRDDTVGGDTMGDGPTAGARGDWTRVEFRGAGSVVEGTTFRYGGWVRNDGGEPNRSMVVLTDGVTFRNNSVDESYTNAVNVEGGSPLIEGNSISSITGSGLYLRNSAAPLITGNTVQGVNGYGIHAADSNNTPRVIGNEILNSGGGRGDSGSGGRSEREHDIGVFHGFFDQRERERACGGKRGDREHGVCAATRQHHHTRP
jgi:parallel beta-helix repeat protein